MLGIEHGFELKEIAFVGEQDILGDRLVRKSRRKSKGANVITEATGLSEGDLVVHVEHGIGRFVGLKTIEAVGAPHDCLELQYAGGDKLYLPVENIELLSRYGSEDQDAQLDKLGGGAWQARKAKLKKRILEIADGLIKTAAERALKTAPVVETPEGVYDEFATRFPYEETDDQLTAIDAVFDDLSSGRPMDRLICGDVGFGKDRSCVAGSFHRCHVRPPGCRGGADHPSGASALQDIFRALPWIADQYRACIASCTGKTADPDQEGDCGWFDRHRGRDPCAFGQVDTVP